MRRGWSWWVLGLVLAGALGLGFWSREPRVVETATRQELFQAVESFLREANVPRQDMPKAVLDVERLPNGHQLVHMQMVQGEGWFEVWQEDGVWKVKGAPPPPQ